MARQGSLCQWIVPSPGRRWLVRCVLVLLFVAALYPSNGCCADDGADHIDARLNLRWEAGDPRFWNVHVRVIDSDASAPGITDVENLCESRHTTGAWTLRSESRELWFKPRHRDSGGAAQIRVRGSRNAKLVVGVGAKGRLSHEKETSLPYREVLLVDLLDGESLRSDSVGGDNESADVQWVLERTAGDELRIDSAESSPIYDPGGRLRLSVACNGMMKHASRALTLHYSLIRISHGEEVSSRRWTIQVDPDGNSDSVSIDETVPELPGVYEVRCRLIEEDENIWTRLRRRESPIVQVGQPIVVLRADSPAPSNTPWQHIGAIRPSESNWSVGQWLPTQTTRFIPGSTSLATSPNEGVLTSGTYAGQSISSIAPERTFQATLPVHSAGMPHKVQIRFPAALGARIRVDVGGRDRNDSAVSFVLRRDADTDNAGGWATHTFVHYPSAGQDQIWLTNLDRADSAGFESITVQAGPSYLASAVTSAANHRVAAIRLTNIDWVDAMTADVASRVPLEQYDASTAELYRLWVACDRIRDYAEATGANGIMVPANSGGRAWFESDLFLRCGEDTSRDANHLQALMRMMQHSQLDVFVSLAPEMLLSEVEQMIREQLDLEQKLVRGSGYNHHQYNFLHPMVQKNLADLVHEVDQQCRGSACYSGIALDCGPQSHLEPISGAAKDQGTLKLFAQSNGEKLASGKTSAVDGELDPAKLQRWVDQQGRAAFEQWLRVETRQAYEWIGQSASKQNVLVLLEAPSKKKTGSHEANSSELQAVAENWRSEAKNLTPAIAFRYGASQLLADRSAVDQQLSLLVRPAAGTAYAALLGQQRRLGDRSRDAVEIDDNLARDLCRIIDRLDPSILLVDHPNLAARHQDEVSNLLRTFTSMPVGGMHPLEAGDPTTQTIRVSSGTHQGHLYVSLISMVPWTSEVAIETRAPLRWLSVGEFTESAPSAEIRQLAENRARIVVPPGKLILLRSKTPAASTKIESWSSRVAGGEEAIDDIKSKVTSIVERIGILSELEPYDALKNGGFEQTGSMGLAGWLHAQYPPGCVGVDDQECVEGNHSVRLTTDAGVSTRTWIVSETLPPPRSGRLAVSLASRAQQRQTGSEHRLRVSIEATIDGKSVRYSNEFNVPRNGKWGSRDVVLEADGIDGARVESLRLTIDSLSGGRVWIDDIQLHDRFPTTTERAELQSQAFLAVQGLQRGNLTPSGRLLQNYWARYLLTRELPQQSKRVIEAVTLPEEEVPGVAERIRSWLPRPLRF